MTTREWTQDRFSNARGWTLDQRNAVSSVLDKLCDPDCPGSAEVLEQIGRRREAARKPMTRAEEYDRAQSE